MASLFSVENCREHFPALEKDQIFGDNAGGSQVLGSVADSISEYLINNNVQLGASYKTSQKSTATFDKAYQAAAKYINAHVDEIVLGASTTQVLRNLAASIKFEAGDEIILSEIDHESNIDPWLHYAAISGVIVKWWTPVDRSNPKLDTKTLRDLLTSKTRLVACTHASNILGSIHDIKVIADTVHEVPRALLCVDGVAYAPHRAIDVREIGADFYAFSWYKRFHPGWGQFIRAVQGPRRAEAPYRRGGFKRSLELSSLLQQGTVTFGDPLDGVGWLMMPVAHISHPELALPQPHTKYAGFLHFDNPGRKWPNRTLKEHPIWLSTDLRDGNQSLINPLTVDQKWEYFQMLVSIGYTEIEVSFPAASQVEFDFTRRLIETPGAVPDNVRIRGLSPTREDFLARTVEALRGAKRASICTYICTSDKQLKYQGFSREQAVEQAVKSVRFLRSITKDDPESASMTDWTLAFGLEAFNEASQDFAVFITEAVKEAWGATVENPLIAVLATSTEVATPNVFADQVELFHNSLTEPEKIRISLHPHNDRGCGIATAELGLLAGAGMVEGCLFGNGERCGNVDLVALALNLYSRGIHPGLDFSNISVIRQKFERLTGLTVSQRAPYAGEFALQAFSGSHQNIIRKGIAWRNEALEEGKNPIWDIPYLPLDPEDLGIPLDQIIRVNSQSGKAAATWILHRRWGLDIPAELQVDFGRRVQMMCEALAREITHQEVINLFIASYALSPTEERDTTSQLGRISIDTDGSLCNVMGTVNSADNSSIRIHGSGSTLESAIIRGLHFTKDSNSATATICHTQRLDSDFGQGKVCVLATCTEGDMVSWGYFIEENEQHAQAMAIVSACLHLYRRKRSALPTQKQSTIGRIDAKTAPPRAVTKA
ncbi:hypothetical protein CkaCkLH20_07987 [Colletotrichum karsti]|uniref:2-isopropylmalate synthase n=1 Tax=Colletotrichum karsti TaxID=1095194 RepID=A0A9P6LFR5_9PEZI|nr:uncharacterized protein CkaCkLH20_07987 [Colletotrichum karsti]KAF9874424.1 hypothetical protein CkaCkLH20_07987 [Colletotrichum karsti]